jgi:asparagine synthase (glutamine-hydrolysing)
MPDDGATVPRELLAAMCARLAHRGPDGEGCYVKAGVGLGHRRLAVIDLDTGQQPMSNEDETVWVVFNGEIYNYPDLRAELAARGHHLRTTSDTEVIVHLYEDLGERCIDRLHGMFAFALWDARTRSLLLVRDRLGKKPLYYSLLADGALVFASELDAILADPAVDRTVDPEAIDAFLSLQYVPAPLSIYKSIRKLPAGHLLRWTAARSTIREYWDVPAGGDGHGSVAEWRDMLSAEIDAAVRRRLRSDVPLGAFVSGGLDSSLVLAFMAAATDRPVTTCTAAFDDVAHDERAEAGAVARHFGCDHHEQVVHPAAGNLPVRIAQVFDEPFGDPAAIPNELLAGTARRHVTVALTGDGGDEVFAGYWRHSRAGLETRARRLLGPVATAVGVLARFAPETRRAGMLPLGMAPVQAYAWKHAGLLFDPALKRRLYATDFAAACREFDPAARFRACYERAPSADPLDKALYVDLKTSLPDDILVKVDRTSMAHGLEVRSPLLDHRIVELAARMPADLKRRGREEKYILQRVAESRVPSAVIGRPKHGLTIPLGRWLRNEWRAVAEDCLFAPAAQHRGLFHTGWIESIWKRHVAGSDVHAHRLWLIVMLELWYRQQS